MISASDIAAYSPLTVNFARRELTSRYKRSLLGWAWSIINPLSTVIIYSLVFGVFFAAQAPPTPSGRGEYFSIYLFNGLVVWGLFTGVLNGSMGWMSGVSEMRKKVYFPAETALFGGTIAVMVQSGLEMLVLGAILLGFLNLGWTFLLFPVILVLVAIFALGLGLIAAILNTRYRDVGYFIGIALSLAFFLLPIVYTPEILPEQAWGLPVRTILAFHPMASFIDAGHEVAYFQSLPDLNDVIVMLAWAAGAIVVGLHYFRSQAMQISEEL